MSRNKTLSALAAIFLAGVLVPTTGHAQSVDPSAAQKLEQKAESFDVRQFGWAAEQLVQAAARPNPLWQFCYKTPDVDSGRPLPRAMTSCPALDQRAGPLRHVQAHQALTHTTLARGARRETKVPLRRADHG